MIKRTLITPTMTAGVAAALVLTTMAKPSLAADVFMDIAIDPELRRDFHRVYFEGNGTRNATASDGQSTDVSYFQTGAAANLWNNERNQLLAAMSATRREFAHSIVLPGHFVMPGRFDEVAAGLMFKHVTTGDWSLNQSIRFTRSTAHGPSVDIDGRIDLAGLAVTSSSPGVAWAVGYIYLETATLDPVVTPVVEYIYSKDERWTLTLGFPAFDFQYSPHPDWLLTTAGVSYQFDGMNSASLSYGANEWAYPLSRTDTQGVSYRADRIEADFTHLYFVDHRNVLAFKAAFAWEFNRELESSDTLQIDDAATLGLNFEFSF